MKNDSPNWVILFTISNVFERLKPRVLLLASLNRRKLTCMGPHEPWFRRVETETTYMTV